MIPGELVDAIADAVKPPPAQGDLLVGVADAAAHKYSEHLSAHTRRGLRSRNAKGLPVRALPLGYVARCVTAFGSPSARTPTTTDARASSTRPRPTSSAAC